MCKTNKMLLETNLNNLSGSGGISCSRIVSFSYRFKTILIIAPQFFVWKLVDSKFYMKCIRPRITNTISKRTRAKTYVKPYQQTNIIKQYWCEERHILIGTNKIPETFTQGQLIYNKRILQFPEKKKRTFQQCAQSIE